MPRTSAPLFVLDAFEQLSASPATALLRVSGRTTMFSASAELVALRADREHRLAPLPGRHRPGRWAFSAPAVLVQDAATHWSLEIAGATIELPAPDVGIEPKRPRGHERRSERRLGERGVAFGAARAGGEPPEVRARALEDELAVARRQISELERQLRRNEHEIEDLLRQLHGEEPPPVLRPREP